MVSPTTLIIAEVSVAYLPQLKINSLPRRLIVPVVSSMKAVNNNQAIAKESHRKWEKK